MCTLRVPKFYVPKTQNSGGRERFLRYKFSMSVAEQDSISTLPESLQGVGDLADAVKITQAPTRLHANGIGA